MITDELLVDESRQGHRSAYCSFALIAPPLTHSCEWNKDISAAEFAVERQKDFHLGKTRLVQIISLAASKGVRMLWPTVCIHPPKGKVLLPSNTNLTAASQFKTTSPIRCHRPKIATTHMPFNPRVYCEFNDIPNLPQKLSLAFHVSIHALASNCQSLYPVRHPVRNEQNDDFISAEIKKYLHADPNAFWNVCEWQFAVLWKGNTSSEVTQINLFLRIIQKSKKVVLLYSLDDAWLFLLGTNLILQNYTWNGAQGFTSNPFMPFVMDGISRKCERAREAFCTPRLPMQTTKSEVSDSLASYVRTSLCAADLDFPRAVQQENLLRRDI